MEPQAKVKVNPAEIFHKCEYCLKTFAHKKTLKKHLDSHVCRGFKCILCFYSTNNKTSLANHMRETHTDQKNPFKCQYPACTSTFANPSDLKSHQLVHNKGNSKDNPMDKEKVDESSSEVFQCPFPSCAFKSGWKSVVKRHLRTHSEDKPFSCDLCPFRGKTRSSIYSHHRNVHSGEKPFQCPVANCAYFCKGNTNLSQHMKVHTGERPWACSYPDCGYKAKRKEHLEKHEKIHRGEKPFKCPHCPYSCGEKSDMKVHNRVHTGETPYHCPDCSYRSKTSSQLAIHVRICPSNKAQSLDQNQSQEQDQEEEMYILGF